MANVFNEDWSLYSNGAIPGVYPSRLGGLWFQDSIFSGHVTDDPVLYGTKVFQFDTTGQIAYWNETTSFASGAIITQVKGGPDTGGSFKLLSLNDAQVPLGPPFPFPVQLVQFYFESDNTISARSPSPENAIMANSGYPHSAVTPLGFITTKPWAFETGVWYIIQYNFDFSADLTGHIVLSGCVHIDKKPVLAYQFTSTVSALGLPNGEPVKFNYMQVPTCKNNTGWLARILLDGDASLTPGEGLLAFGKVSQGVIELLTKPDPGAARVSQGVIELPTIPTNFARVTQAVIEILSTDGGGGSGEGWKVREA